MYVWMICKRYVGRAYGGGPRSIFCFALQDRKYSVHGSNQEAGGVWVLEIVETTSIIPPSRPLDFGKPAITGV